MQTHTTMCWGYPSREQTSRHLERGIHRIYRSIPICCQEPTYLYLSNCEAAEMVRYKRQVLKSKNRYWDYRKTHWGGTLNRSEKYGYHMTKNRHVSMLAWLQVGNPMRPHVLWTPYRRGGGQYNVWKTWDAADNAKCIRARNRDGTRPDQK